MTTTLECQNCGHDDDDHERIRKVEHRNDLVVTHMSSLCHCGCTRLTVELPIKFSFKDPPPVIMLGTKKHL